jgi:hypothetical protein
VNTEQYLKRVCLSFERPFKPEIVDGKVVAVSGCVMLEVPMEACPSAEAASEIRQRDVRRFFAHAPSSLRVVEVASLREWAGTFKFGDDSEKRWGSLFGVPVNRNWIALILQRVTDGTVFVGASRATVTPICFVGANWRALIMPLNVVEDEVGAAFPVAA